LQEKALDSKLRSIIQAAVRAPSSHNTQPWRFTATGEGISLYADRTRALPANDPNDRELVISCGCALMNLRAAAAQEGYGAVLSILPSAADEDHLATLTLVKASAAGAEDAKLYPAIEERRTYRKRFVSRGVTGEIMTALQAAAGAEGAWLHVLDGEKARHDTARLVGEGDAVQWANPGWRRELARWMHPRRKGDGLTVPGLVAPVAQAVVRTFDMGNGVGAKDTELAEGSPVLALLGTERDDPAAWLAAGQALERVLLTACLHGLQCSYLNQPIQVAVLRPRLQKLTGRAGFPQILLRLGYPSGKIQAAPRRAIDAVIDGG